MFLLISNQLLGQLSSFEPDTTFNKKRTIITSSIIGATWVGSIIGLKEVWYKDSWTNNFHTFDDAAQWMQMDKAGHVYAGSFITDNIYHAYQWSGLSRNKSLILGTASAFGYLATFETLDGFSDDWGFSWADLGANGLGVLWFSWQELVWQEQRLKLKFSAHLSPYAKYRPNVLGGTTAERLLKDYNGQTYWLTINPSMFMSESTRFPKWLGISLGYSVDEKMHGVDNTYYHTNNSGNLEVFNARRQYLLSLDIDLSQIPAKKPWLKTLLKTLNHVKVPFPAVEFSSSGTKVHGIYF